MTYTYLLISRYQFKKLSSLRILHNHKDIRRSVDILKEFDDMCVIEVHQDFYFSFDLLQHPQVLDAFLVQNLHCNLVLRDLMNAH